MRIGSLFSGAGMLDEGVRLVLGGTVAWHCETDPAASRVLDHRYPGVPNLGDITAVDWATVEPVDVLTGGWPCQPFSLAGKQLGADDERALWPEVERAVRLVRPGLVVLENVSAVVSAGELARAVGGLAACGYVGSWCCVRASDVGAPHRRERVFVVAADAGGEAVGLGSGLRAGRAGRQWRGRPDDDGVPGPAADAEGVGRDERRPEPARLVGGPDAAVRGAVAAADTDDTGSQGAESAAGRLVSDGCAAADAVGGGRDRRAPQQVRVAEGRTAVAWGRYEPAVRRWERLTRPAPDPTELAPKGGRRLSPRFTEWMQGWPDGWCTDVPGVTRNDMLKICGNGVVPQQASEALRRMLPAAVSGRVA